MVNEKWGGLGPAKNEGAGACLEQSISPRIFGYFFFD